MGAGIQGDRNIMSYVTTLESDTLSDEVEIKQILILVNSFGLQKEMDDEY